MTRPGAQFNSFSDLLSLMLGLTILNDVFLCSRSLNKWQWSWFDTAINCQINHPQSSCAIVHSQESNFISFTAFNLRSATLTVFHRLFPLKQLRWKEKFPYLRRLQKFNFHRGLPIIKSPGPRILQTLHDAATSAISFLSWLVVPNARYNKPYLLLFL